MPTNRMETTWRTFGPIVRDIVFSAAEALFARETNVFLPVLQTIAETHGLFLDGASRLTMHIIRELDYMKQSPQTVWQKRSCGFPSISMVRGGSMSTGMDRWRYFMAQFPGAP